MKVVSFVFQSLFLFFTIGSFNLFAEGHIEESKRRSQAAPAKNVGSHCVVCQYRESEPPCVLLSTKKACLAHYSFKFEGKEYNDCEWINGTCMMYFQNDCNHWAKEKNLELKKAKVTQARNFIAAITLHEDSISGLNAAKLEGCDTIYYKYVGHGRGEWDLAKRVNALAELQKSPQHSQIERKIFVDDSGCSTFDNLPSARNAFQTIVSDHLESGVQVYVSANQTTAGERGRASIENKYNFLLKKGKVIDLNPQACHTSWSNCFRKDDHALCYTGKGVTTEICCKSSIGTGLWWRVGAIGCEDK